MQAALPEWSRARLPFFSESASILPPASTVPALPRAALTLGRLRLMQPDDEHARIHGPSQSPAGLFTLRVRVFQSMLLLYNLLIGLCSSIVLQRFWEFGLQRAARTFAKRANHSAEQQSGWKAWTAALDRDCAVTGLARSSFPARHRALTFEEYMLQAASQVSQPTSEPRST